MKCYEALVNVKLKELDMKDKDGLKVVVRRAEIGLQKFSPSNYGPYQSCRIDNDECTLERSYWKGYHNGYGH